MARTAVSLGADASTLANYLQNLGRHRGTGEGHVCQETGSHSL